MKSKIFLSIIILVSNCAIAQNVGIGTTTPTEKLHVTGNIKSDTIKPAAIKLTPNAGEGKVLVSDALGNASWQGTGNIGYGVWGDCATNGNVSEYQPVVDENPAANDQFGGETAIAGNFAIVAAESDDVGSNVNQGSASIFQHNGTNWIFMQKITDPAGLANDDFGKSVSISENYAIVGAKGAALIYKYNGNSWVFMQKITDATGEVGDNFGKSVGISGTFAIVSAESDKFGALDNYGSASIFKFNGSSWVLMQKLIDATGGEGFYFGYRASISGNNAIISARFEKVGANVSQGSASIYQFNGTNWVLKNKLTETGGSGGDYFGCYCSISGNYAAVGVQGDDIGPNANQGSVIIYQFDGTNWVLAQKLTDATGSAGDYFGTFLNLSGNYMIASTYFSAGTGEATIFMRIGLGWYKIQTVKDPAGFATDGFGSSVGIDGVTKRFIIGVPKTIGASGKVVFGKVN